MTRVRPIRLAAVLGALLAPALVSPASAHAAGAPPYKLEPDGFGRLAATPAAGGSTLAVTVEQVPGGVEFRPAAVVAPQAPGQCVSSFVATTCPHGMLALGLRLEGLVLEASVSGLTTALLAVTGGPESDSLVVDAAAIDKVALDPKGGDDAVTLRGSIGEITLAAGDSGDDRYRIESTNPTITGTLGLGDGNDFAYSLAPNLTIDGGPGDDVLSGAGPLLGGAGSDVLRPTRTDRPADGGAGATDVDRLSFELVPGPLTLQKLDATTVQVVGQPQLKVGFQELEGTPGHDTLIGHPGPDALFGGAGADTIIGHGGGDVLDGGPGINTVSYAPAAGPVTVDLGAGTGTMGGPIDTLRSFAGVITGSGNDVVVGTAAAETFTLGAGNDVVNAGPGNDVIHGGEGNDVLRGGLGDDLIDGGPGNDSVMYDERGPSEPVNVALGAPGSGGAAGEHDTLLGIENVFGGASNDVITGDAGPNALYGGPGLDTISGLAGNDVVYGGDGRDTIDGGPGSDLLYGEGDDDSINAFDGEPDVVDCGASPDDDAQVDGADSVAGCEYARRGDVPVPVDADGDGFVAGFDCNDADPAINPGAVDVPGDGIDQNCDGVDEPVPFVDFGLSLSFSKATTRGRRATRLVLRELPSSHRVQVSCKTTKRYAKRCPFTRRTRRPSRAGNVSLTSLFRKRVLPPGTTIELQITAPGFNGRVRRFTIRRVGAVRDQRLCLRQGTRIPRRCPAGEE